MQQPSRARVNLPNMALLAAGFGGTCLTAIAALGPAGAMASLIFIPLLAAATFMNVARAADRKTAPANDNRSFIMGCLSRFLGEIGNPTVLMIIEIDDHQQIEDVYGRAALDSAMTFARSAIEEHLTDQDVTVQVDGYRFVAALAPVAPHETETMLNTCTRIQHALMYVPHVADLPVQITASIGFASSDKLQRPTAEGLMRAASAALSEARRRAPGAVRAYSEAMLSKRVSQKRIVQDAQRAFEKGEIFAYFQPQIDLETGALSGFEALTRWHHPENGIIAPADFLPTLEQAGMMQMLGETMIKQALQALSFWDKSGLDVPRIGVNFSTSELRNPRLVDRIAMHLDANDIAPERLVIEVLETVIADEADDDIIGNLAALADLGCGVDLDDFGTGYASITNIRRFSVGRIKIDRSFVEGIDSDSEQRNMVSAILTMARRLNVKALAEGVETRGQREVLYQLGCHDAQGFRIARPMQLQETVKWATAYFNRAHAPVQLSKRAS